MSSYNENLHSSVVSSLSAQELELQKVKTKYDASMFSLYYAQSARITTSEKLEVTTNKYYYQQNAHGQAVRDSDLSTNVLTSANNVKSFVAKSVSNTAVAAANVQIASNAILKLASDVGSIYSIINAADFDTDIHQQAKKANSYINKTAYLAERTSQHSMESSASIAEVAATSLAAKATATDGLIKDLLAAVTTHFNDTTATLTSENAELASTNTEEKKAEGNLQDIDVTYKATADAYKLSNKELNLDLTVAVPDVIGQKTTYTVSFNPYEIPFHIEKKIKEAIKDALSEGTEKPVEILNPVESYNIMLVKNSNSGTFSMSNAEGIIANQYTNRYSQIIPDASNNTVKGIKGRIEKEIVASVLKDVDGKDIQTGEEYVIFVLAVLTTQYKKMINTFDDYLSAPSKMFKLTDKLNAVYHSTIKISDDKKSLSFWTYENEGYKNIQYRCIYLPENHHLTTCLLTAEELGTLTEDGVPSVSVEKLIEDPKAARPGFLFNRTISEQIPAGSYTNADGIDNSIITPEEYLEILFQTLLSNIDPVLLKRIEKDLKKIKKDIKTLVKDFQSFDDKKHKDWLKKIIADLKKIKADIKKVDKDFNEIDFDKLLALLLTLLTSYKFKKMGMTLKPETTDNFGNRFINGNKYIPVVLALINGTIKENKEFTNALSNFKETSCFPYENEVTPKTY
jgi:hypothetical protein